MPDAAFAPLVLAAADGAWAAVLPYGAHVVGWRPAPESDGAAAVRPAADAERLFVSARAEYHAGAAIRGGVPVIFPQFGDRVPGPDPSIRHGFARTRPWKLVPPGPTDTDDPNTHAEAAGARTAIFTLADDAETRARWPHAFRATLRVRAAGPTLTLALDVENTGAAPFAFTGALHTYLRVGDAARARVLGLEAAPARDQAAAGAARDPLGAPLGFGAEVDHLYPDAPPVVALDDPALGRATRVAREGWRDVVVWNPGPERGAALADLEPDGWRHFVCVEAVAAEPVVVAPGARWRGAQRLTAAPPGGR